jgi:hypothetical protein
VDYARAMKALHIHAGEQARLHISQQGLRPQDIRLVPAAAGGPKGLILTHLDQQLFGRWLLHGGHTVHLVGGSIGAWRMATAALPDPVKGFADLAEGYIHQHVEPEPGRKFPTARRISANFETTLQAFFGPHIEAILRHPRMRLHVLTSRGRHVMGQAGRGGTALGFTGLALGNVLHRRAVGLFMERTVFSSPGDPLPLPLTDLPTRHVVLGSDNFLQAMRASCAIPFMLEAVQHIPGAPGAHWDGGIVDYHLHWPYARLDQGLALYPHFQRQVVPGWLDKALTWRHRPSPQLSKLIVLAPNPEWVAKLPQGRLPNRDDFAGLALRDRIRLWTQAVAESQVLADEWQAWLDAGCPVDQVKPL